MELVTDSIWGGGGGECEKKVVQYCHTFYILIVLSLNIFLKKYTSVFTERNNNRLLNPKNTEQVVRTSNVCN